MSDFPPNFISYVNNNQYLRDRGIFDRGFVFSTLQQHHPPSQPPPFSKIIDLDSETPIAANQELIGKIKSIMKWIVFCPGQFLVQFWKVIEIGGRRLLTTQDQPFGLSTTHEGLCSYRLISLNYQFYVDGESEADLGLPGRVFRHRRPESSPNVQYYSCKEYPQRDHDVISKVRRSWALPVLESYGRCCVGVLELVAAAEPKYPFTNLIDGIYKRVEEVGLRSSETCNHLYNKHKYEDEALKDALAEIKKVLIEVCKSHDLPLAQTWVPCRLCNPAVAGGSFNVSCREHLMFRFDIACCRDKDKLPFVDVCTLHSLGKGQGVVGKAFSSHNLVFCKDITQFSIIEYPLVHYACKYGLTGCFSICLRSSYNGDNVYVLEFFLRPSNNEGGDPKIALVPLLTTLKQHFRSFKVASGEELGEELSVEVIDSSKEDKLDSFQIPQIARSPDMMKNGGEMDYLDLSDQQLMEEDVIDTRNNVVLNTQINNIVVTSSQQKCITNSAQRQQRKAGIPISSEDIQQHVGMKLDDAAASLHDSQSTLKRACSEYGITGWSCRKRNKDNLALSNKFVQGVAQEQIQESSQPPISDPPCKQDLATTYTKAHSMATQDTSIVTIKAKHGENFIKFKFPVLSGMVEFQQEVAKRLHLEDGTYSVKYQDDGNNWILIACDEELRDYISKSKSLGKNIVTMSLEPNYNKFVQGVAQEQIQESSQPPISDRKQDLATTCAKVHSMATQDIVTIKAKHGENFIKFKLSVLSGMVEFQQEVAKRLQLEDGTYSVKYQDDGNNWILIACDEELRDYISKSKSLGKNIVTMSLEPNYDELVHGVAQEQIQESSQSPIFDPPRKQDLATTCAKVHSLATQDTSTVTIKAKHGENFIKFKLPVLSGMVEFQQEVAKRLQLEDGTYSVKYQDDGNNWILIACDEELRDYISKSKSLGKNIVTMSLEPNYNKLVQDAAQEQIRESSQPPISDPPRKQDLATTCAKVHSLATQDTSTVTSDVKSGNMVFEPVLEEGVFRYDCIADHRNAAFPSLSFVNPKDRDTPIMTSHNVPSYIPTFECVLGQQIVQIELPIGTSFYGTGEVSGQLERTGKRVFTWNTDAWGYGPGTTSLYQSHPWVLAVLPSGEALGVLADTTRRCEINLQKESIIKFVAPSSYPVITFGPFSSPTDVLISLSHAVGTVFMPPKWSLGYHQCRWSYDSDARVREIARTFREKGIPCDVIWMDIDYMNGFRCFTFDQEHFPDPKSLVKDLHLTGFKAIWMLDPGIKHEEGYFVYDSGSEKDVWIQTADGKPFVGKVWPGPCVFPDFTLSKTRSWWAGLVKDFISNGVDGIWNDMNEPAVFKAVTKTMPETNVHRGDIELGGCQNHSHYHNVYGMLMARSTYEGMKLGNENNRPFVLTRAGFIGSQRYAATWTGDNLSTWVHLHMSISMVLQLGLSGQPLSGPDIGGFAGNATPKLFGRWMALGAMLPFCRGHSETGTIDHEPWSFGEECEEVCRLALKRRYRLLPHIYTLFYMAHTRGTSVATPTFFADPKDPRLRTQENSFMLGPLLIYTSTVSDQGIDQLQLVLPKGIWLSFDFDDSHPDLPALYLQGGSIIPLGPVIQHVGEANPTDDLSLLVALDEHGKAKGVLFEDDGDGYEFTRGGYLLTTYVAELESSVVTVRISETEGSWKRPKRRLRVQLLLGGCAMLDAWGIDGEVLQIMMPSEDEVSNLVSMSEKQYKIRMENAKRIPEVEKVSGRKGVELSRTPIELKNGVWALKVVPWIGGRIISMEHLPSGTQWLHCRVEVGGYEEFSGTEYRSAGWSEEYTVIERNLEQAGERESLMLEGDIGGGVVIERHISFPKDNSNILRIDSGIVACKVGAGSGGFSRLVCLRVHPMFALSHPTETYVSFTSVNGSHHEVWPESGEKFFEGDLRPNGEWMLVDRCLGLGLVNRFNVREVNKCFIHWGTGTINLELWSDDRPVSKQSPLKISHEYEVRGIA